MRCGHETRAKHMVVLGAAVSLASSRRRAPSCPCPQVGRRLVRGGFVGPDQQQALLHQQRPTTAGACLLCREPKKLSRSHKVLTKVIFKEKKNTQIFGQVS